MNINVTGEMEEYLKMKVDSGEYGSCEQVVEEALRLLRERHLVYSVPSEDLNSALQPAIEQVARGEGVPLNDVVKRMEELKRRTRDSREKSA